MRMWSRGLGRKNLGIDLGKVTVLSLEEAVARMPSSAADDLVRQISSDKLIALSGKVLPPIGWDFVIIFERKDIFAILLKLLNFKAIKLLFFPGSGTVYGSANGGAESYSAAESFAIDDTD